jgi:transcriptional regulator with XRE-family HTH domain
VSTQSKMPKVGPIGRTLITNVERLRQARGLSWRKLSAELEKTGTPIPERLSRMTKGQRRIDVDELTGLAQVLDVTPDDLLAAPGARKTSQQPRRRPRHPGPHNTHRSATRSLRRPGSP